MLKQFVGKLPTNCLNVFDHFVVLALKKLKKSKAIVEETSLYFNRKEFLIVCFCSEEDLSNFSCSELKDF